MTASHRLASARVSLFVATILVAAAPLVAQVPAGPGDWPQWRGPNRDGISTDKGLLKQWPEAGPDIVWQVDSVGVGYSSLAVKDDRIFTQGDLNGVEHIIALDAKTGQLLWAVQPEPVAAALNEQIADEMKAMDRNNDGIVDEVEALSRLGWKFNDYDQPTADSEATQRSLAEKRAAAFFKSQDTDQDGKLTFDEAGGLLRENFSRIDADDRTSNAEELAAKRTAELLKQLDKDGDGKVSKDEARRSILEQSFNRIDQRDPESKQADQQLTGEEIETYLTRFEAGKDGVITTAELTNYYAKNLAGRDGVLTAAELRGYYGGYRNGQGDGPRGTPIVDGNRVYAEGGNGDVTCLDASNGKTIWHVNLRDDFGGGRPGWGYSESPLIEGDMLIVTPGGKNGTVAALNKHTGELIWQSGEVTEGAHYSSAVVAEIGGIRQIVQFARESVFGLKLETGEFLWKYSGANNGTANAFTPIVDGDRVFVSSAYGTGSGLAKVSTNGDKQSAEEVYFIKKLASHHGGAVKIGDYLYSNGGGALMCIDYNSGEIVWQDRSVGKGSLVAADGMLYVLSESHAVALVEATPEGYREHGSFRIENLGRRSWAHPVVAGGRLYVRNQQSLTAYDVRGN